MKKIGVTGGICSGKSTVCAYIEKLGYDVFYSDQNALYLAENNQQLKDNIIETFGNESYCDGQYNRKFIANIVFSDKNKLDTLNSLFKPFITESFDNFCISKEIVFYESALIFEHHNENKFDFIINIYASNEVVIKRLKERNKFTNKEIENRLNSQSSVLYKLEKSDFSIDTSDGTFKKDIEYIISELKLKNVKKVS